MNIIETGAKEEIPEISAMHEDKSIFEPSLKIPEYINIISNIEKIMAFTQVL